MQKFDLFRLDAHALRVFLSVCETGSISRTADVFGVNQSTISYTLDKLRSAIGDPLFVKSGRGIIPTDKAISMTRHVQEIIASFEGILSSEDYDPTMDNRPITIGVSSAVTLSYLKRFFLETSQRVQSIDFNIRSLGARERLPELLESGDIDIALAIAGLPYPVTLNHVPFCSDPVSIFYDPSVRGPIQSLNEFANARHAALSFGGGTPSIVQTALAKAGVSRRVELRAPNVALLGDFIRGTDLITTMPFRVGDEIWADLARCLPPLDLPDVKQDLVWHRRFDHSGRHQWLRETLLNARDADFSQGADTKRPADAGHFD